ncbi:hypothetical protein THAOC_00161, partial [Thalassiosira oceanica]
DEDAIVAFEEVTREHLQESHLASVAYIGSVKVISQTLVVEAGETYNRIEAGEQQLVIANGNRGLLRAGRKGSGRRLLSLEVGIRVAGIVKKDFDETNSASPSNLIEAQVMSDRDEIVAELGDRYPEFFPAVEIEMQQSELAAPEDEGNGPWSWFSENSIVIISGCAAGIVIIVGSVIFHKMRSGPKRRRIARHDEANREVSNNPRAREGGNNADVEISASCSTEERLDQVHALEYSPQELKTRVKKKQDNIFVITDTKELSKVTGQTEEELDILHSVSSLSDPTQMGTPMSAPGGFNFGINHSIAEKMIGDQFDTRAIMTPLTPRRATPSGALRRSTHSFSSPVSDPGRARSLRKGKTYDIYAPAGPLGIIIDTTPEGPMIHSLKPTSHLLGKVSPGDLIVGLDNVDTRNMTAATFTRLMAKRSQGERKISLFKGTAPFSPRPPLTPR